jgi:hypothetical protein
MKQLILLTILFLFTLGLNAQVNEKIDRGVVALAQSRNSVYVGWRLLKTILQMWHLIFTDRTLDLVIL